MQLDRCGHRSAQRRNARGIGEATEGLGMRAGIRETEEECQALESVAAAVPSNEIEFKASAASDGRVSCE